VLVPEPDSEILQTKVGVLPKDTSSGPFIDEWKKTFGDISKSIEEIDISPAISASALAIKDENELVRCFMGVDRW
jgi:nucleosome binding factor SPN SPT16 subunit